MEAIQADIDFIKAHGVQFRFGVQEQFSIDALQQQGFKYIFIGVGAQVSGEMKLSGDNQNVRHALDFLREFKTNPDALKPGKSVAIVGGGNTAMDSARAATRIPGVENVAIIYRRTKEQMPADMEEFDNALEEGVKFMPLLLPENFSADGLLTCRKMKLGEVDASGRQRPEPTEETVDLKVDTLITAIGEKVNTSLLQASGLEVNEKGRVVTDKETLETSTPNVFMGGDAFRGPSTVVESMADARKAAESVARKEMPGWKGFAENPKLTTFDKAQQIAEINAKKAKLTLEHPKAIDETLANVEASRCLECHVLCNKCVTVCPNRANVAIKMQNGHFRDAYQILHLDALCNECGNCGVFCPYDGKPYKDKLTLFVLEEDFANSENNGFLFSTGNGSGKVRLNEQIYNFSLDAQGQATIDAADVDAKTLAGVQEMIQTVRKDYSFYLFTPATV